MAAGAVTALMMLNADPAGACSRTDGTVPGSSASVVTVPAGEKTFYVDDRDQFDLDGDDVSGGIWIYEETNDQAGLQRGGPNYALDASGIGHRRLPSDVIWAAYDVHQRISQRYPGTLFPPPPWPQDPTVEESLGLTDHCWDSTATPDRLWF